MSSPRKKLNLQRLEFHVVWRRRRRRSGLLCRHKDTETCSAQLRNWTTFLVPKTTFKPQFKERKVARPYFSKTSEKKLIPKSFKSLSLSVKTSSRTMSFRKFFSRKAPKSFNSLPTSQQTAIAKELLFLFFLEQPDTELGTISYFRKGEYSWFSNKLDSLDVKLRSSSSSPPLLIHGVVAGSRWCATNGCYMLLLASHQSFMQATRQTDNLYWCQY